MSASPKDRRGGGTQHPPRQSGRGWDSGQTLWREGVGDTGADTPHTPTGPPGAGMCWFPQATQPGVLGSGPCRDPDWGQQACGPLPACPHPTAWRLPPTTWGLTPSRSPPSGAPAFQLRSEGRSTPRMLSFPTGTYCCCLSDHKHSAAKGRNLGKQKSERETHQSHSTAPDAGVSPPQTGPCCAAWPREPLGAGAPRSSPPSPSEESHGVAVRETTQACFSHPHTRPVRLGLLLLPF